MALISETYYTKLERGKVRGISQAVLDGLGSALSLTAQERQNVSSLIQVTGQSGNHGLGPVEVTPALRQMLESLAGLPVHLQNERADIIATTPVGRAIYPWHFEHTEHPNNVAFLFEDPRAKDFFVDWQRWADQGVSFLRTSWARDPHDPELMGLVLHLIKTNSDFAAAWQTHEVTFQHSGVRELNHPVVGRLTLDFQALQPIGDPRLRLIIYSAEAGSETAERLARLA